MKTRYEDLRFSSANRIARSTVHPFASPRRSSFFPLQNVPDWSRMRSPTRLEKSRTTPHLRDLDRTAMSRQAGALGCGRRERRDRPGGSPVLLAPGSLLAGRFHRSTGHRAHSDFPSDLEEARRLGRWAWRASTPRRFHCRPSQWVARQMQWRLHLGTMRPLAAAWRSPLWRASLATHQETPARDRHSATTPLRYLSRATRRVH